MNDLDKILEYISKPENKGNNFNEYNINKALFPKLNEKQVEKLLFRIDDSMLDVADIYRGNVSTSIESNGLTIPFLNNGGFTKIESEHNSRIEFEKEKEQIEFRKSKIDLELAEKTLKEFPRTKWFARIGLFIAVVLALKELYIWLMQSLYK